MSKRVKAEDLTAGMHIVFNDRVHRVNRMRRVSHEEGLLALSQGGEHRVKLSRTFTVVD